MAASQNARSGSTPKTHTRSRPPIQTCDPDRSRPHDPDRSRPHDPDPWSRPLCFMLVGHFLFQSNWKVLLCTTKYYSSTTLYYKVLLCTTKYDAGWSPEFWKNLAIPFQTSFQTRSRPVPWNPRAVSIHSHVAQEEKPGLCGPVQNHLIQFKSYMKWLSWFQALRSRRAEKTFYESGRSRRPDHRGTIQTRLSTHAHMLLYVVVHPNCYLPSSLLVRITVFYDCNEEEEKVALMGLKAGFGKFQLWTFRSLGLMETEHFFCRPNSVEIGLGCELFDSTFHLPRYKLQKVFHHWFCWDFSFYSRTSISGIWFFINLLSCLFGGSKDGDPPKLKTPWRWLDFIAQFFRWTWRIRPCTLSPSACTMILSTCASFFMFFAGGQKGSNNTVLYLGGGFNFFNFHPYLGKWSNLTNMFQLGWNHQLVY